MLPEEERRHFDVSFDIDIAPCTEDVAAPIGEHMYQALVEIAVKWFSTGFPVALGKVYNKCMIHV